MPHQEPQQVVARCPRGAFLYHLSSTKPHDVGLVSVVDLVHILLQLIPFHRREEFGVRASPHKELCGRNVLKFITKILRVLELVHQVRNGCSGRDFDRGRISNSLPLVADEETIDFDVGHLIVDHLDGGSWGGRQTHNPTTKLTCDNRLGTKRLKQTVTRAALM